LAEFLDDESWSAARDATLFPESWSENEYFPLPHRPYKRAWDGSAIRFFGCSASAATTQGGRHGYHGWLHTSVADVSIGLTDGMLVKMLKGRSEAIATSRVGSVLYASSADSWTGRIKQVLDPNHANHASQKARKGWPSSPISRLRVKARQSMKNRATPFVQRGRRSSPRELMLEVRAKYPEKARDLDRVPCYESTLRRYRTRRESRRRGDPPRQGPVSCSRETRRQLLANPVACFVKAGGEVILCGGSFNTPQLLMLSGLGDETKLVRSAESASRSPMHARCVNGDGQVPP